MFCYCSTIDFLFYYFDVTKKKENKKKYSKQKKMSPGVGRNSNNVLTAFNPAVTTVTLAYLELHLGYNPTVVTEMSECKECELGRYNNQLGYLKTDCVRTPT